MGLNLGCARCKSSSKLGFRSLGTSFHLSSLLFALFSILCTLQKMGPQPHFFVAELLYQSLFAIDDVNARFCNLVKLAAGDVVNDFALCVLLNYLLYAGVVRL